MLLIRVNNSVRNGKVYCVKYEESKSDTEASMCVILYNLVKKWYDGKTIDAIRDKDVEKANDLCVLH